MVEANAVVAVTNKMGSWRWRHSVMRGSIGGALEVKEYIKV